MSILPEDGGLADDLADLRRRVAELERSDRLVSSSVGAGGMTVNGGEIVIKDAAGDVIATLGTSGLSLAGLLEILDEAKLQWSDEDGNVRYEIGRSSLRGSAERLQLTYQDASGAARVTLGEWKEGSSTEQEGLIVTDETGIGLGTLLRAAPGNFYASVGGSFQGQLKFIDGGTDDLILRSSDSTAAFRFLANGHMYVSVDGVVSGKEVTFGAADSGGAGFRLLRVPN